MSIVADAVRRQALHPFSTLPTGPGWERVEGDHVLVGLHHYPFMVPVEPRPELASADVAAAIDEVRRYVGDYGRTNALWLTGPDHPWLGDALAAHGLKSEDSPGFESVENAMTLLHPPAGSSEQRVRTTLVESFDDFVDSQRVQMIAFGMPPEDRVRAEAEMEQYFADYSTPGNPAKQWNATVGGRVVGTAGAVLGDAGINLFGGSVLPEARGRGVYRALVQARWELALARGTPALTVQAGRMSGPVLAALGFELIASMPTYVDEFAQDEPSRT